jgi:hypothetical protein
MNHLVRTQQQGRWDTQTKRIGRLEVDREFEPRRLLNGKFAWFGALQDLVDVPGGELRVAVSRWPVGDSPGIAGMMFSSMRRL